MSRTDVVTAAHERADLLTDFLRQSLTPDQFESVNWLADLELEAVTLDVLAHRDHVIAAIVEGAGPLGPEIRRRADRAIAGDPFVSTGFGPVAP